MEITESQADEYLQEDLNESEQAVCQLVKVSLTQGQFDALVSFTFNLGAANLQKSTLLRKLNEGDYKGAEQELSKWVHVGKQVIDGLVIRRNEEQKLFGEI